LPGSQAETQLVKAINDVRQKEILEELEAIKQRAAELAKRASDDEATGMTTQPEKPKGTESSEPSIVPTREQTAAEKPADIYEKMLQQLDRDMESGKGHGAEVTTGQALGDQSSEKSLSPATAAGTGLTAPATQTSVSRVSRVGPAPTLEELNARGYKVYMDLAAEYMRQKKYYRAAETYALARVYRPDQAESYRRQGWAMFATGEYMSSAYYLGRAIEMDPNEAAKKADLNAMFGSEYAAARVQDLSGWQKRSYSPEMQFLLAYVLYQTGQMKDAEDEIRAASVKMENYQPATILKGIILGGGK